MCRKLVVSRGMDAPWNMRELVMHVQYRSIVVPYHHMFKYTPSSVFHGRKWEITEENRFWYSLPGEHPNLR